MGAWKGLDVRELPFNFYIKTIAYLFNLNLIISIKGKVTSDFNIWEEYTPLCIQLGGYILIMHQFKIKTITLMNNNNNLFERKI